MENLNLFCFNKENIVLNLHSSILKKLHRKITNILEKYIVTLEMPENQYAKILKRKCYFDLSWCYYNELNKKKIQLIPVISGLWLFFNSL